MKILLVLALATVAFAKNIVPFESGQSTLEPLNVYGYIRNHAIPLAEKIRKAEEKFSQERIASGSPAVVGQFPYQAGLVAEYHGITAVGICGGSLVTSNRVITAAHCWNDGWDQAWRFTVVLGSVLLFSGGTRILTSSVVMHPNFSAMPISNDVAVIYLPQNVAFSGTISPIALPSGNELTMDYAGVTAVASGFGLTGDGASISVNQFLSHVTLPVITNSECIRSFPWSLQSSNICTGGVGGIGTCRGDSGGPLVYTSNNRRILIGIDSFGSALGCEAGLPSAFARVTSYMSFFNQHIS